MRDDSKKREAPISSVPALNWIICKISACAMNFSAICSITEQESLTELDIERIAEANNKISKEVRIHLKRRHDGYHFSKHCADIFWFSTDTPTFLIDLLRDSGSLSEWLLSSKDMTPIYVFTT